MVTDLTCGETGSTAEDIINRVNEHDASINNTNLIINGNMLINQREFDGITWVDGQYSYDRWKATATAMTQIIEDGSYKYNTIYTLSGIDITTQEITSPSSGHWTLPDIPRTAIKIKLEEGTKVTPYQPRLIGEELALCQRYYHYWGRGSFKDATGTHYLVGGRNSTNKVGTSIFAPVKMRITPSVAGTGTFRIDSGSGVQDTAATLSGVNGMASNSIGVVLNTTLSPANEPHVINANADSGIEFDAEL